MATNPGREPGLQRTVDFGNERLLTELVKQLPDGSHLWMAQRASSNLQALNDSQFQALLITLKSMQGMSLIASAAKNQQLRER